VQDRCLFRQDSLQLVFDQQLLGTINKEAPTNKPAR